MKEDTKKMVEKHEAFLKDVEKAINQIHADHGWLLLIALTALGLGAIAFVHTLFFKP